MSINKIAALAASLLVAAGVIGGLYLGGSPGEQRLLRFDERRVEDLRMLSAAMQNRWEKSAELPQALDELVDGQHLRSLPTDPASGSRYVYEPLSANSYRLCAEFARATLKPMPNDFWRHDTGYRCFAFTLP